MPQSKIGTLPIMALSPQQIEAALGHALPGATLRSAEPQAAGATLTLSDGRTLILRLYTPGAAEPQALSLLATCDDVPAPRLAAFCAEAGPLAQPYGLLTPVEGGPLTLALPRLDDHRRYELGHELGAIIARVHRVTLPSYGTLADTQTATAGERAYTLARLEQAIEACGAALSAATAKNLRHWFDGGIAESGRHAALCHAALDLARVLVRPNAGRWQIGGIVGWGDALGWRPGWDHAAFLESAARPDAFSLRVGYGEGYEEATERTYDQVREHALAPYRLIMHLERAATRPAEAPRHLRIVEAMLAALLTRRGDDERFDTALTA
jgi:hypothetical protein